MTITARVKHKRSGTFTEWKIEEDKYNEYYLPSLGPDDEMWIVIEDHSKGTVTKLHLKR